MGSQVWSFHAGHCRGLNHAGNFGLETTRLSSSIRFNYQKGVRGLLVAATSKDTSSSNQVETAQQEVSKSEERIFSSLSYVNGKFEKNPGSLFGATALIAGTTIGAGILAVPAVTKDAGFVGATIALTGMWLFSVVGGLLLAEVNLNTLLDYGRTGSSVREMANRTIGSTGSKIVSTSFIFLHCAMLVAYIARAGELISGALPVPAQPASIVFAALLGSLCYGLKPKTMDNLNSVLVLGVLGTFLALLISATPEIHFEELQKFEAGAIPSTLPTLSLAFIYQSIIPVVATSLEGDIGKIRTSVVVGTGIPLLMFLAWDAAILGSLGSNLSSGQDPIQLLIDTNPTIGPLVQAFSFLALTTSFIGFSFALVDFLNDLLQVKEGEKSPAPFLAAILPPTLLALTFPGIFFQALDSAGTYGVIFLFGLMPAIMARQERQQVSITSQVNFIPGGTASLLVLGLFSAAVIMNQTVISLSGVFNQ